jgi:hypothetical protein
VRSDLSPSLPRVIEDGEFRAQARHQRPVAVSMEFERMGQILASIDWSDAPA